MKDQKENPAPVAYDKRIKRSRELVKAINGALNKHEKKQSKDVGNWGYPGDLGQVNKQLENILKFLVPNTI